jgi:microcystin-dependent protein
VNFALPDLRGRTPAHVGDGLVLGQRGGLEAVTIDSNTLPTHTHGLLASAEPASSQDPTEHVLAKEPRFGADVYAPPSGASTPLAPGSLTQVGGSQAHKNLQPFLTLTFAIALTGIFPSAN